MYPKSNLYLLKVQWRNELNQEGFKILEHPADLGIEAYGKDLREAFEQAAVALMSIILDLSSIKHRQSMTVELSATDYEHLLVKWLTEVLYLYDGKGFVGNAFHISELGPTHLKATIMGEQFDHEKHPTLLDVKAVTYHQLLVKENGEGLVRVFLDI